MLTSRHWSRRRVTNQPTMPSLPPEPQVESYWEVSRTSPEHWKRMWKMRRPWGKGPSLDLVEVLLDNEALVGCCGVFTKQKRQ